MTVILLNIPRSTIDIRQCNMFLADFKSASSYMRNYLFSKYCTSFYGSNVLPLYDDSMENLCKSWRIAIRRVWRIPWRTHCICCHI